jgi:hypothetical protein
LEEALLGRDMRDTDGNWRPMTDEEVQSILADRAAKREEKYGKDSPDELKKFIARQKRTARRALARYSGDNVLRG